MKNVVYEAWERFLLYLPLMVMGVLALGTYWLVRSTPAPEAVQAERVRGHEPDYFMHGFSIKTYDATGRMRSEVEGEVARHYPDTQWIEIDRIRIRSFDAQGRLTTASAQRGLTNDSGSEVQLMGKAVVVREADKSVAGKPAPRMEYRGEFLHAFMDTEVVKSHQPVELTRGNDRFTADAMEFDNVDQVMKLRGRVRGTLVPEPR
ncbi:MAG: LPS export ABC transporter periplasmic protein LptC [Rhodoferax sp.]|nr:LPS export ABC transporter periplasmic protein LptC [Rhodoferax sp.]MDZ7921401.1 LPS export ABC transporter periplasmic protein LptC [Rhodoferax sp.]